jgi:hypothetical protein
MEFWKEKEETNKKKMARTATSWSPSMHPFGGIKRTEQ